jgi:MOSC domain-containing protein YiiM
MKTIAELKRSIPQTGKLGWIGLADRPRAEIRSVTYAELYPGTGVDGDHHAQSGKSDRQVTLLQKEHLAAVAAILGRPEVEPELLRRNLVVSGINVASLKDQQFSIGEVLLEGTGPCPPCSRMEENLGPGGYNAMRGHGGICARVLKGGVIRVGDSVAFQPTPAESESSAG